MANRPTNERRSPATERLRAAFLALAIILCFTLAFLIYGPRIGDFFVYDDFFFLNAVRNHSFPAGMVRAFTFPTGDLFDQVTPFWRPLIDVYFYAFKPLGIHAQPYHIVNILLHGLVGALAVLFIWRLTRSAATGAISGLLFVVAPTYDFAVSWVVQVSELLGAALMLAALLSFHAWLTSERPRPVFAVATTALTVLALLTKESTVILAVLLPVLAVAADGRHRTLSETVRVLAPPIALCLAFALAMGIHELTQPDHLQTVGPHMARNLWRYLEWMVFPYQSEAHLAAREAGAAIFLALGVLAVLTRQRALAFLFAWTLIALVPFVGFDEWIELRYTYLATLPFVSFVVTAVVQLTTQLPMPARAPLTVALGLAIITALVATPMRTRDQQVFLIREADRYETMIDSAVALCGPMPPDSHVYIKDPPYRDLGGLTTAALDLYYDRVYAWPVEDFPPLIAFVESKCALEYDRAAGTYHRVTQF